MCVRVRAVMTLLCLVSIAVPGFCEKYALLVGINEYPGFSAANQLHGCLNDVALMQEMLTKKLGFDPGKIRCLKNSEATATGIVKGFQDHLINGSKAGDTVLFYYSGHGTQAPDTSGDESDGKDEALVTSDVQDIEDVLLDDTLGELTDRLADRYVVFILDSCHSGTGIRSISRSRYISFDDAKKTEDPRQLLRQLRPAVSRSLAPSQSAFRDVLGGKSQEGAVLLAACRPEEKAQEPPYLNPRHGIFTLTLCRLLSESVTAGRSLSYSELRDYFASCTEITQSHQNPQIECPAGLQSRPVLDMAVTPETTTLLNTEETSETVSPLRVYVAPYGAFFEGGGVSSAGTSSAIASIVSGQPFVRGVASREEAEASVYYGEDPETPGKTVVGVLLSNGSTSVRIEAGSLNDAALAPIIDELRRLYLVVNLLRLRSADGGMTLTVKLAGNQANLGNGDKIMYEITARRGGYLTLVNVDCQGGIQVLLPNSWNPSQTISAGETINFPPADAAYEAVVEPPLGEKFLIVLLTEEPLALPGGSNTRSASAADTTEMLKQLYRGVRLQSKALVGFEELGRKPFSQASLLYKTYAN